VFDPIIISIALGGVVAIAALGGISVRVFRRKNSGPSGVLKAATAGTAAADPKAIKPGDHVTLEDRVDTFRVDAVALYMDDEDPEDRWYEYELWDEVGRVRLFLAAELDDEDRWVWTIHEILTENQVLAIPELAEVTFTQGKPPKQPFNARGATWKRAHDGYNYPVRATDQRLDRPAAKTYQARISDYESDGRELSVELWNGGRCVSIGRPLLGRVLI
jgi:hypothetical protein